MRVVKVTVTRSIHPPRDRNCTSLCRVWGYLYKDSYLRKSKSNNNLDLCISCKYEERLQ